jgi:hypothetical protein
MIILERVFNVTIVVTLTVKAYIQQPVAMNHVFKTVIVQVRDPTQFVVVIAKEIQSVTRLVVFP